MKLDIKNLLRRFLAWSWGLISRVFGWNKQDAAFVQSDADQRQWRKLASRGHQLLAQVLTLEHRGPIYLMVIGAGVLAIPMALWISSTFAKGAASSLAWAVDGGYALKAKVTDSVALIGSEKVTLNSTKAPKLAPIQYVEGKGENDPAQILNVDQVRELMLAWGPMIDKGVPIPPDQCAQDKKIHAAWFGDHDVKIRCRVSADKKRVWAWGYVFASKDPKRRTAYEPEGGGFAAVLYRTTGQDGWTLSRVEAGRRGTISMYLTDLADEAVAAAETKNKIDNTSVRTQNDSIARLELAKFAARERFAVNLSHVPRSIGTDFPELVLVDADKTDEKSTQTPANPIYTPQPRNAPVSGRFR